MIIHVHSENFSWIILRTQYDFQKKPPFENWQKILQYFCIKDALGWLSSWNERLMLVRDGNFMLERKIKVTLNFARFENLKKVNIKRRYIIPSYKYSLKPLKICICTANKRRKKPSTIKNLVLLLSNIDILCSIACCPGEVKPIDAKRCLGSLPLTLRFIIFI